MGTRATIAVLRTNADMELGASVRRALEDVPQEQGRRFSIKELSCSGPQSVSDASRLVRPDLSILIEPPERSFFAQLATNGERSTWGRSPFLLVLPEPLARDAPLLLKAGASDFVLPPVRPSDLIPRVLNLLQPQETEDDLVARLKQVAGARQLVGQSSLFLMQLRKVFQFAECDATVLISGETGTGKELCARAIHYLSRRAGKSFIALDCGAVPPELLENELFGHERGAYTTALTKHRGLIDEAAGGSLLLDEVDSLPMSMQVKLLRFLQEKEYRAVGSTEVRKADVRVMAASNTSLEQAVRAGRFRQDLFYRLNVLCLEMPPLRDRREDIPLLAHRFLEKYADEFSRPVRSFTEEAIEVLADYPFPGNARELENLIERAVLACDGPLISTRHLELPFQESVGAGRLYQARKNLMVKNWERDELKRMLAICRGNLSAVARAEGKDASAFRALLRKHHLRPERTPPYWDVRG